MHTVWIIQPNKEEQSRRAGVQIEARGGSEFMYRDKLRLQSDVVTLVFLGIVKWPKMLTLNCFVHPHMPGFVLFRCSKDMELYFKGKLYSV
ncbi:uncharacterized [Tachysurus ichikawai]